MGKNTVLSEEEAYLKTLLYISLRDETLSPDELTYFRTLGQSFGFTRKEMDRMITGVRNHEESLEQLTSGIRSVKMKLWLVSELVSLCYADGEYSIAEKSGMREICRLISLDEPSLEEVEASFSGTGKDGSAENLLGNLRSFFSEEFTASTGSVRSLLSSAVAHAAANGLNTIGSEIPYSLEGAVALMKQNREIREILEKEAVSDAVKEKLVAQLSSKVSSLRNQLAAESDGETITSIRAQIDDLLLTIRAAAEN